MITELTDGATNLEVELYVGHVRAGVDGLGDDVPPEPRPAPQLPALSLHRCTTQNRTRGPSPRAPPACSSVAGPQPRHRVSRRPECSNTEPHLLPSNSLINT